MLQPEAPELRFDDRTAYRAWVSAQGRGRWERQSGVVVAMAPERVWHTIIKYNVWQAFRAALAEAGSPCKAIGDGVTVEIDDDTDYEPDMVVSCDPVGRQDVAVRNPVVVVEVLSPSTAVRDGTAKLADYFRLPSVRHYLLVSADAVRVIHHARQVDGTLRTAIHGQACIQFPALGIAVGTAGFYNDTDLAAPPAYTGNPT